MNIELEILDQIVHNDPWPLSMVIDFISPHREPWTVVGALYFDGCIAFLDTDGEELKRYQVDEVLREKGRAAGIFVAVTDRGVKQATGDDA